MTFENLNLIEPILKALEKEGYTNPTPIQEESIPIVLDGFDLLGCAQTGTGKTAAFSIPIIQHLHKNAKRGGKKGIKALILTPTRELAIQIGESFYSYGRFTELTHAVIFGGVSQKPQTDALRSGIDILVATPGRLIDLINQGHVDLRTLEYFVLDEADRMLDMGFIHDIKRILPLLPKKRQSLFFSATMPAEIAHLANNILQDPKRVEVTPQSSTVEKIDQCLYYVEKDDKKDLLIQLLKNPALESVLVFARTKHGCDKIAKLLDKAGYKAEAIHGNKSQNARQRALSNFKDRTTRILIATDIAARGIDVDHLSHVINYELPNVPETYVHRIGRTGRAGREGAAIAFCDGEEVPLLRDIHKVIGIKIPIIEQHDFTNADTAKAQAGVARPKSKEEKKWQGNKGNGDAFRRQKRAASGASSKPATATTATTNRPTSRPTRNHAPAGGRDGGRPTSNRPTPRGRR